jgi:radical SAM family RiPP maturation amino acid epimerase
MSPAGRGLEYTMTDPMSAYEDLRDIAEERRWNPAQLEDVEVTAKAIAPGQLAESSSDAVGIAHAKRFFEVWMADAGFRAALVTNSDPREAATSRGLVVDPLELRYLWDDAHREQLAADGATYDSFRSQAPPATRHFLAWIEQARRHRDVLRSDSEPTDPRFAAWRRRQLARSATMFRRAYDLYTPHIVFAIELSKGCSVGCWFCGVSAPKLDAHFLHDAPNRRLFVDVLSSLNKRTGTTAGARGFLYWATDPFDNPDFEKFCVDFAGVFGRFPIVTTAQPQRDVARTRSFLDLAKRYNAAKVRFSATTLRILDRVHRAFSAEELATVDVIPINKGSMLRPAASGRAREHYLRQGGEQAQWAEIADTSISCVSGFLVSMVDRTVKLITPCVSSEKWPLGYYVYDERKFVDASDFDAVIEEMTEIHMPLQAPDHDLLQFRADLAYRGADDGFVLTGRYGNLEVTDNPLLRDIGDAIAGGGRTAAQIADEFTDSYGLDQVLPLGWINQFFALGVFDEEPKPRPAS